MNFIINLDYLHLFSSFAHFSKWGDIMLLHIAEKGYIKLLLCSEFQDLKWAVSAEFLSID